MGRSVNRATVSGNLGADPELRTLASGRSVATLSLATQRNFKVGEEWKTETDWHKIVVWGRDAERVAESVSKGDVLTAEGRIQYRTFEGKDGQTRYVTEIVAQNITCGKKVGKPANIDDSMGANPEPFGASGDVDDIEF